MSDSSDSNDLLSDSSDSSARANNPANRSSTLKCSGCKSETGMAIAKAEHVIIMEDPQGVLLVAALHNSAENVKRSAVVIWFGCKHYSDCKERELVQLTYEYCHEGVRVKRGPPPDYANAYKRSIKLQPLPHSQVAAIMDVLDWPAADYNAVTHSSQHWACEFVQKLQNATAEKVPDPPFKIVKVDIFKAESNGKNAAQHKVCTEKVKFWDRDLNNDVTVKQMADKALEQSDLKAESYEWRQVKQSKKMIHYASCFTVGYMHRYVDVDIDAPIEHNALYKVVVEWQEPKFVVRVDIFTVEQGRSEALRSNMEMKFWEKEVTVAQMAAKALKQSDWWMAEYYQWHEVKQRKQLADGSTEFVEVASVDPIEHAAFYKVEVVRKQKKILNAPIVEPGQQQVDDQPTTNSNAPIQQPSGEESSSGAVPTTIQSLDVNARVVGEEDIAENEREADETMQENDEFDDEPNTGNHDNHNAALRDLEQNQASNEGNASLDVPMALANITVKEEIQEPHRSVGPGCWSPNANYTNADWAVPQEIKRENNVNWPAEIDEMMDLPEQQPTTSKAAHAPPPVKRVDALREKHELEAILKQREERRKGKRFPIDPDTLPIPPGYAIVPDPADQKKPTRPKRGKKK